MGKYKFDNRKLGYQKILLTVTSKCNLSCPFCAKKDLMKKGYEKIDTNLINKNLLFDKWNTNIAISGGEPFFDPEAMFAVLDDIDFSKVTKLSILTNATIYDDKIIDKLESYGADLLIGMSPKVYFEDWNLDVISKFIKRLGRRATINPVFTFENIERSLFIMNTLYDLGLRTWSLHLNVNDRAYFYPYLKHLDHLFKNLPDDLIYLQPYFGCVSRYYDKSIKNSFAAKSKYIFDLKKVTSYIEDDLTLKERLYNFNGEIGREVIGKYYCEKYNIRSISVQHECWYDDNLKGD